MPTRTGVLAQGEEFEAREAAERGGYLSVQAVAEQLQLLQGRQLPDLPVQVVGQGLEGREACG